MNVVVISGNLTRDPELRSNGQMSICRMTVAVNDRKKNNETGEREDNPSFVPVVVFGRQAENCDRYLHKGRKVSVQGRLQTGSYVNKEGNKVYTTDVIANVVEFERDSKPKEEEAPTGFEAFAAQEEIPW